VTDRTGLDEVAASGLSGKLPVRLSLLAVGCLSTENRLVACLLVFASAREILGPEQMDLLASGFWTFWVRRDGQRKTSSTTGAQVSSHGCVVCKKCPSECALKVKRATR